MTGFQSDSCHRLRQVTKFKLKADDLLLQDLEFRVGTQTSNNVSHWSSKSRCRGSSCFQKQTLKILANLFLMMTMVTSDLRGESCSPSRGRLRGAWGWRRPPCSCRRARGGREACTRSCGKNKQMLGSVLFHCPTPRSLEMNAAFAAMAKHGFVSRPINGVSDKWKWTMLPVAGYRKSPMYVSKLRELKQVCYIK